MASSPFTSWQIDGETVADFIFWGSKITADGDCSHEIKRHLLLGRKVMSNQDSILKSRDLCQQRSIQSRLWFFQWSYMDVSVGLKGKLSIEELMLLNCGVGKDSWRVPCTARRSNQSILKEISPGCYLEGLTMKRKLNSLATWCKELTHLKRPWCWERLRAGGKGDDRGWDGWIASSTQ